MLSRKKAAKFLFFHLEMPFILSSFIFFFLFCSDNLCLFFPKTVSYIITLSSISTVQSPSKLISLFVFGLGFQGLLACPLLCCNAIRFTLFRWPILLLSSCHIQSYNNNDSTHLLCVFYYLLNSF